MRWSCWFTDFGVKKTLRTPLASLRYDCNPLGSPNPVTHQRSSGNSDAALDTETSPWTRQPTLFRHCIASRRPCDRSFVKFLWRYFTIRRSLEISWNIMEYIGIYHSDRSSWYIINISWYDFSVWKCGRQSTKVKLCSGAYDKPLQFWGTIVSDNPKWFEMGRIGTHFTRRDAPPEVPNRVQDVKVGEAKVLIGLLSGDSRCCLPSQCL